MTVDWSACPVDPLIVNGKRLDYACHGPAPQTAPTIVMLHEGLGCVQMWKDFPEMIASATGMGVFAYSRLGYGRSDPAPLPKPIDILTREATAVLPDVLDAIRVKSAILLGHSDGATIAAIHAGSVSDFRIRGLVLMAPHFFTEPMGLAQIRSARTAFETDDLRERLAKYHRDPDNAFRGWNEVWLDPDFESWDVTEVIDYIRVPCLAMQGREDPYGTLAQIEVLRDRSYAPVDVAILDDCGHSPHRDQPEMALELVAEFAARLQRIETAAVEPG